MHIVDRRNLKKILKKFVPNTHRILDIGSGVGDNLQFMKSLGYTNVVGVDISREMVDISNNLGHQAFLVEDLDEDGFDVLLFSHVVEHVGYPEIKDFFEHYFRISNPSALVIVITPILYNGFFNDVDHIKPYYPDGLMTLFSKRSVSRQYSSEYQLYLEDIYYRRVAITPYNVRIRHAKNIVAKLMFRAFCLLGVIVRVLSLGAIAKVTGYAAIFRLTSSNDVGQ